MGAAWQSADLALCRAGASTIAELASYKVPSILIPLPTAAGGHQEANADAMADAGAALAISQQELSAARLVAEVGRLIGEKARLEEMAESAAAARLEGGAASVAEGLVAIARRLTVKEREELLGKFKGARQ
jgi:UDP-N-acetylglucosamine--N-acetylmuramyl-(pentapeptide) pyrophosphoryl-undecaprenol N-acetylglucosamine transferase